MRYESPSSDETLGSVATSARSKLSKYASKKCLKRKVAELDTVQQAEGNEEKDEAESEDSVPWKRHRKWKRKLWSEENESEGFLESEDKELSDVCLAGLQQNSDFVEQQGKELMPVDAQMCHQKLPLCRRAVSHALVRFCHEIRTFACLLSPLTV